MDVERRRARRRVPRTGADHAVHPRHLRGRGRAPARGLPAPRALHRRPRRRARRHEWPATTWCGDRRSWRARSGDAGSRSSRRRAASGSSSWSSWRRAPREGHPLPPRVGELPRRVARRHDRVLRRAVRPRRRAPARDPRRPRHLEGRRRPRAAPRGRAAARDAHRLDRQPLLRRGRRPRRRDRRARRPGHRVQARACRASRTCRSGSTTPPATPSSCNRTRHRQ